MLSCDDDDGGGHEEELANSRSSLFCKTYAAQFTAVMPPNWENVAFLEIVEYTDGQF